MNWMQRYSRLIAGVAMLGLVLPFVVSGLSSMLNIEPLFLSILLALIAVVILTWRYITTRTRQDDDAV